MKAADRAEYIIGCLREAGAMYPEDARAFLAEHDADHRAEVLREAADAVAEFTGNQLDANAKLLRRMADDGKDESTQAAPGFFQPGHGYTRRDGTTFRCVAVTNHPDSGGRVAIGWHTDGAGWTYLDRRSLGEWLHEYDDCAPPSGAPALSADLAAYVAAGTCTCRTFPTGAHRADLHDENGLVRDIVPVASGSWGALVHAHCTRCGWKSRQTWLHEEFTQSPAQTYIAEHRDRWTGACVSPKGEAQIPGAEGGASRG